MCQLHSSRCRKTCGLCNGTNQATAQDTISGENSFLPVVEDSEMPQQPLILDVLDLPKLNTLNRIHPSFSREFRGAVTRSFKKKGRNADAALIRQVINEINSKTKSLELTEQQLEKKLQMVSRIYDVFHDKTFLSYMNTALKSRENKRKVLDTAQVMSQLKKVKPVS